MIITNSETQNGGALLAAKRRKEAKSSRVFLWCLGYNKLGV